MYFVPERKTLTRQCHYGHDFFHRPSFSNISQASFNSSLSCPCQRSRALYCFIAITQAAEHCPNHNQSPATHHEKRQANRLFKHAGFLNRPQDAKEEVPQGHFQDQAQSVSELEFDSSLEVRDGDGDNDFCWACGRTLAACLCTTSLLQHSLPRHDMLTLYQQRLLDALQVEAKLLESVTYFSLFDASYDSCASCKL